MKNTLKDGWVIKDISRKLKNKYKKIKYFEK